VTRSDCIGDDRSGESAVGLWPVVSLVVVRVIEEYCQGLVGVNIEYDSDCSVTEDHFVSLLSKSDDRPEHVSEVGYVESVREIEGKLFFGLRTSDLHAKSACLFGLSDRVVGQDDLDIDREYLVQISEVIADAVSGSAVKNHSVVVYENVLSLEFTLEGGLSLTNRLQWTTFSRHVCNGA